jgi:hypothetical protein
MFSFSKRKSHKQIEGIMRRLIDRTTPNLAPLEGEVRYQNRHNRSLPILLTPGNGKQWAVDQTITGFTKDISDRGLSVILTAPVTDHEQVAIAFWLTARGTADLKPSILAGRFCHCMELGGGFWQVGIELSERIEQSSFIEQIIPLAWELLPANSQSELLQVE